MNKKAAMLEAMFDHATTGVLIVDKEGNILMANPFVSNLFGYDKGEMIDMKVDALLPLSLKNTHKAHRDEYFTHPKSRAMGMGLALSGRRKDDSEFPVEISLGHTMVDGAPLVIAFVNDVSLKNQILNNLIESNNRLDEVQALAHFGSFEWVVKDNIFTISDELFRITGHAPNSFDPSFENYQKCIYPDDQNYFTEKISKIEVGEKDLSFEYRLLRPDGNIRQVRSAQKTQYDSSGALVRLYGLIQDVTDIREQEETNRDISKIVEESLNEIFIFDAHCFKFVQVNKGARLNLGYTLEELKELTPADIKPFHTKETFFNLVKPLINKTIEQLQFETTHERKDGSHYPVDVHLQLSTLSGRSVFVAIILDVSERKKAQADLHLLNIQLEEKIKERTIELAQNQKRLKETNRIAKIGHWELNLLEDNKTHWSDEYKQIFEVTESLADENRHYFLQFCSEEDKIKIQEESQQAINEGRNVAFEYKITTTSGNEKHVLSKIYCEKDDQGKVVKLFGILQDITSQKQSELQLQISLTKERELSELKSRFVSMASHEFRTPLTSIMGSADIIKIHSERGTISKQEKHIKRIKSSVNNLTSILNDFLSLEKLESGKLESNPEPINLTDFMSEVCEEVEMMTAPDQNIRIDHQGENIVRIDPHLVKNILINLLSNAIKYSPNGQDVNVSIVHSPDQLIIKIKDSGIGIPEKDQQYMFTRFFRASNANTIKGTGLGLTIVKRYLDLMDGDISFVSNQTEGTTFTVRIPQTE